MDETEYRFWREKAEQYELSPDEKHHLAQRLQNSVNTREKSSIIYLLGRSFSYEYEQLIAQHLYCQEKPVLVERALRILCRMWEHTEAYLDHVFKFLHGVEWDEDGFCQLCAIQASGGYLRTNKHYLLLKLLLEMYDNPSLDEITHEALYEALAEAVGFDWNSIQGSGVNEAQVDLARKRLESERNAAENQDAHQSR